MEKLFNIISTLACIYVMYVGLVTLNKMSRSTNHFVRCAFIVLTIGAMCNLLAIWHPVSWQTRQRWGFEVYDLFNVLWTVGVAVFVWAVQRRKLLTEGERNETRAHS